MQISLCQTFSREGLTHLMVSDSAGEPRGLVSPFNKTGPNCFKLAVQDLFGFLSSPNLDLSPTNYVR